MLGNYFYAHFSNKIIYKNLPIFNNFNINRDGFEISPFLHFSSLFTNYKYDFKKINDNFKTGSIRLSSGFGISILSKLFSFEIIYTPYIKKEITDIHSKFSVKFGID
jgi:outer membrane protein assembly factor BamA